MILDTTFSYFLEDAIYFNFNFNKIKMEGVDGNLNENKRQKDN